jgi:hypothetical protein
MMVRDPMPRKPSAVDKVPPRVILEGVHGVDREVWAERMAAVGSDVFDGTVLDLDYTRDQLIAACDDLADRGYVLWVLRREPVDIVRTLWGRGEPDTIYPLLVQAKYLALAPIIRAQSRLPIAVIDVDDMAHIV